MRREEAVSKLCLATAAAVLFGAGAIICGCFDGDDDDDTTPRSTLLVNSGVIKGDMMPGVVMAFAEVSEDGSPLDNATVRINGTALPSEGPGTGSYVFMGTLVINDGDNVTLAVTHGTRSVGATLVMPEAPVVTVPTAAGSPYNAGANLTVQWNALSPAPEFIELAVEGGSTASGFDYTTMMLGTATSHVIPAGTLKSGTSYIMIELIVGSMTSSLGADAALASEFGVGNYAVSEPFDTQ